MKPNQSPDAGAKHTYRPFVEVPNDCCGVPRMTFNTRLLPGAEGGATRQTSTIVGYNGKLHREMLYKLRCCTSLVRATLDNQNDWSVASAGAVQRKSVFGRYAKLACHLTTACSAAILSQLVSPPSLLLAARN